MNEDLSKGENKKLNPMKLKEIQMKSLAIKIQEIRHLRE